MADCPFNSASETIADFIYRYGSQQQFPGNSEDIFCMDFVSTDFSIISVSYTHLDVYKRQIFFPSIAILPVIGFIFKSSGYSNLISSTNFIFLLFTIGTTEPVKVCLLYTSRCV